MDLSFLNDVPWTPIVTLITIVLSAVSVIYSIISNNRYITNMIRTEIKGVDTDIKSLGTKLDADMRAQTARTDKLYEMFIMFQEKMDHRFREVDQKFYDLLKSQKERTDP